VPLAVERKSGATVEVRGWNVPAEARRLPVPAGGDWATVFHPAMANPVRVRLESHPCFDVGKAAGALTPPFTATGHLAKPGAAGTFAVVARKGRPLSIRVESRDLGLEVNPVVRVLDGPGKQLARAEPAQINKDSELTFNPPADGTYTIEVRDLHNGGGPRFVYLLRIAPPEPGFDPSVAADRFALKPGTPLDIPVTVARKGGFVGAVDVAAEGLPAGVTATVMPPAGKADPNKVMLRLTAEKPGPSGLFRVVGRAKDLPGVVRTAAAPLAEFETTTPDLWLAVGGEAPAAPTKKMK
jgi:hypothetical protein